MSNQAPKMQEEPKKGAPAWVMTFADLMSLLMCFFVLLLSFSELDLSKYKQIAGSMEKAFGIQREVKVYGVPKGTSIIAREFTPGRPSPSILDVIRQDTTDQTKDTLDFTDVKTEVKDSKDIYEDAFGAKADDAKINNEKEADQEKLKEDVADTEAEDKDKSKSLQQDDQPEEQTLADAGKLLQAMSDEIKKGIVEVETEGKKILVRIREKGSFPSGSATFRDDFIPVLSKLSDALTTIRGKVLIAGHTDNIPIHTNRFRSNWELSASRAVSVIHELLKENSLDQQRFLVEGHGEAHPLVANDTRENRALNRRVELTIVQGRKDDESEEAAENLITRALNNQLKLPEELVLEVITEENPFPEKENEKDAEKSAAISAEVKPHALISVETLIMNAEQSAPDTQKEASETSTIEDIRTNPATNVKEQQVDINDIEARIRSFSEKMQKLRK